VYRLGKPTRSLAGSMLVELPVPSSVHQTGGGSLGSVRQMVNPSGAVAVDRSYEPFGEVLTYSGTQSSVSQFTAREVAGTGLVYLLVRHCRMTIPGQGCVGGLSPPTNALQRVAMNGGESRDTNGHVGLRRLQCSRRQRRPRGRYTSPRIRARHPVGRRAETQQGHQRPGRTNGSSAGPAILQEGLAPGGIPSGSRKVLHAFEHEAATDPPMVASHACHN